MIPGETRPLGEYPSPETLENLPSQAEASPVEPNPFRKDAGMVK